MNHKVQINTEYLRMILRNEFLISAETKLYSHFTLSYEYNFCSNFKIPVDMLIICKTHAIEIPCETHKLKIIVFSLKCIVIC